MTAPERICAECGKPLDSEIGCKLFGRLLCAACLAIAKARLAR